jgi:ribosomal protein S18 acetylase RimI-like enzyme
MAESTPQTYTIRHATKSDVSTVLTLIKGLAEYEKALSSVQMTESLLLSTLCFPLDSSSTANDNPKFTPGHARCLLLFPSASSSADSEAEAAAGMALYYTSYSTWTGPGIYLEDLYITPENRRKGYGKALLSALARQVGAVNPTGNGRLEWEVLRWNRPSIDFYVGEGVGAELMEEWVGCRVMGEKLARLASG